jgi:hypothetical protein
MGLEFGDGLLDRVKVGRVGRQVAQLGSGGLDDLSYLRIFVGREIVHHDDIAGAQGGHQALPKILDEDRTGHGSINDEGRGDPVLTQPSDERQYFPMPPRHPPDNTLAAFGATAQSRHVGRRAGFINEDQLGRIEKRLLLLPGGARRGNVRPLLLGGVYDFF